MNQKKIYPTIDVFKLICAVLVVFMHTYCFDMGTTGYILKHSISTIGVPFFFITSGFFFGKGLDTSDNEKKYLLRFLKRNGLMYVLWAVITFPVSMWNISIAHSKYSICIRLIYWLRSFFLSGTMGIYWYILSLLICGILIYVCRRIRKEYLLYIFGILGFVIGVMFTGNFLNGTPVHTIIRILFGSERNFFNVGLIYTSIGYGLRKKDSGNRVASWCLFLFFSIVLDVVLQRLFHIQFMQLFAALSLFELGISSNLKISTKTAVKARKFSTVIYFTHFPIILLFDYYLKRGTIIDFLFTIICSLAIFLFLKAVLPKKWLTMLYGK